MASVFVSTDPLSEVDYSLADGRVREFTLRGQLLYSEYEKVDVEGWKGQLVAFVEEVGLSTPYEGRGLHAFVYKLIDDGLLPESNEGA